MLNRHLSVPFSTSHCPRIFHIDDQAIYVYSGSHAYKRANAVFLLCSWLLLYNDKCPEEVRLPTNKACEVLYLGHRRSLQYISIRGDDYPLHSSAFPLMQQMHPSACTFDLVFLLHQLALYGMQRKGGTDARNKKNAAFQEHGIKIVNTPLSTPLPTGGPATIVCRTRAGICTVSEDIPIFSTFPRCDTVRLHLRTQHSALPARAREGLPFRLL